MPFSRSRSVESMTRSTTSWLARNAPVWRSMASTRVVLPWSTWATMATLRRAREEDMGTPEQDGRTSGRGGNRRFYRPVSPGRAPAPAVRRPPTARATIAGEPGQDDRHEQPRQHHDQQRPDDLVLGPQIGAVVPEHHQDQVRHRGHEGGEDARATPGGRATTPPPRPARARPRRRRPTAPAPPPSGCPGPLMLDSSAAARVVRSRLATTAIAAPSHIARSSRHVREE